MSYLAPEKCVVIDIEADSLTPSVVWCMAWKDIHSKENGVITDYAEIRQFFDARKDFFVVGHNILGYDAPVLNRLVGTKIPVSLCIDTFLLSMVYNPSLSGGHSLDAWGKRLRFPKGVFSDWSKLSDEMIVYCTQDVELCALLFDKLSKRMAQVGFTERGIEIEHKAWHIIKKQQKNGFHFNQEKAHKLYVELRARENEVKQSITTFWPPQLLAVANFKKAYKKDGSPGSVFTGHQQKFVKTEVNEDGSYVCYDWVSFNLGSPVQRVEKLLELGWKPVEKTKGGGWKVTDKGELVPSLKAFLEENPHEGATLLARWITINSRANMVGTWLDAYNNKTGCIHGQLYLANTLRYRHSQPNSANIPRLREGVEGAILRGESGDWTYECRDLFDTRSYHDRTLVGVDAKGIQLRVLAHYLNNPTFTDSVLSKDPHEANKEAFGLPTRAITKTITYAILMGAGDGRIASEAKITFGEAKAHKAMFFSKIPELATLQASLKSQIRRTGRIKLCDGTPILVSSDHMGIPYLLQGDESRIMKQALIYVDKKIQKLKLDALKVADVHDEWQYDVAQRDVERFLRVCEEAFARSGRSFDYNLPIACSSACGHTWAETH